MPLMANSMTTLMTQTLWVTIGVVENFVDAENDGDDDDGGRGTVDRIRASTLQTAAVRDTNAENQRLRMKTTMKMTKKKSGEQTASARQ